MNPRLPSPLSQTVSRRLGAAPVPTPLGPWHVAHTPALSRPPPLNTLSPSAISPGVTTAESAATELHSLRRLAGPASCCPSAPPRPHANRISRKFAERVPISRVPRVGALGPRMQVGDLASAARPHR